MEAPDFDTLMMLHVSRLVRNLKVELARILFQFVSLDGVKVDV